MYIRIIVQKSAPKVRLVIVAAQRQRELMAIIAYNDKNEDAEWVDRC